MKLLNRRNFINTVVFGNLILFISAVGFLFYKFISYPFITKDKIVKVGLDKLTKKVNEFPKEKIAIIRKKESFLILSSICPHLGCVVKWDKNQNIFQCPCHQSVFSINGDLIRSPAKKSLNKLKFVVKYDKLIVWLKSS